MREGPQLFATFESSGMTTSLKGDKKKNFCVSLIDTSMTSAGDTSLPSPPPNRAPVAQGEGDAAPVWKVNSASLGHGLSPHPPLLRPLSPSQLWDLEITQ